MYAPDALYEDSSRQPFRAEPRSAQRWLVAGGTVVRYQCRLSLSGCCALHVRLDDRQYGCLALSVLQVDRSETSKIRALRIGS